MATYTNPVWDWDFPDPHVTEVDGTYYAYATNASGKNVQMARSTDLISWEYLTDAMPSLASWERVSTSGVINATPDYSPPFACSLPFRPSTRLRALHEPPDSTAVFCVSVASFPCLDGAGAA